MCSLECTAEEQLQVFADEAYDKGISQGISQGIISVNELYSWLFENNRQADVLRATSDPEYLEALFEEYNNYVK